MSEFRGPSPTVLIVGAGWIGRQIALRMAMHGVCVQLYDRDATVCEDAMRWMDANQVGYATDRAESLTIDSLASHRTESLARPAANWTDCVIGLASLDSIAVTTDIILECVTEQISIKRRVLRELSERFPGPMIIASNSSYFTPSQLCKYVRDDSRFAHLHFHAPLHRATVADVVGCSTTQPHVLRQLCQLAESIGQRPLILGREHPGYIFNWLLQSLLRSALELAEKGVATPVDIDRTWKTVSGMLAGPFEIMDEIGLDLVYQALSNSRWVEKDSQAVDNLLKLLNEFIAKDRLGKKTGVGFFEYGKQPDEKNRGEEP